MLKNIFICMIFVFISAWVFAQELRVIQTRISWDNLTYVGKANETSDKLQRILHLSQDQLSKVVDAYKQFYEQCKGIPFSSLGQYDDNKTKKQVELTEEQKSRLDSEIKNRNEQLKSILDPGQLQKLSEARANHNWLESWE